MRLNPDIDIPSPLPDTPIDMSAVQFPKLEFAFRVRIFFRERVRFEPTTPQGGRVYVPPAGGDITGPMLQGRVVPYSGADWARGRHDGASELNAHYMFEASDGTPIYINNRGFLYGRTADKRPIPRSQINYGTQTAPSPNGETQWKIADDTYFTFTPTFDVPEGPHDWLTRVILIGMGKRIPAPDHTVFNYFVVNY